MVVPLVVIAFNLLLQTRLEGPRILQMKFPHIAAVAFGMGAYTMMFGAFRALVFEQKSIWLLCTFPKPLHSLLERKAVLWAGLGLIYPVAVLAAAAIMAPELQLTMVSYSVLALAGVAVFAFVASGLGALATDPLEENPQQAVDSNYLFLYMLLAGTYAQVFFTPSVWGQLVQLFLSALLAVAIWQKARERLPFVLDPTQAPPPRLGLGDGLIAALLFFTIQSGVFLLCTLEGSLPVGARLVLAYLVAGLAVTAGCLLVLWRRRVPGMLEALGLSRPSDAPGPGRALLLALAFGAGAAAIGFVYLRALEHVDLLRIYRDAALSRSMIRQEDLAVWLPSLAVGLAPVFEEFIFRGLVFRGIENLFPRGWAVVASAGLFAVVHPAISVPPVFCLGIATALVYARTRWLLAPIMVHVIYNSVVVMGA
jgi:ABC-2 type transport system permease protein